MILGKRKRWEYNIKVRFCQDLTIDGRLWPNMAREIEDEKAVQRGERDHKLLFNLKIYHLLDNL